MRKSIGFKVFFKLLAPTMIIMGCKQKATKGIKLDSLVVDSMISKTKSPNLDRVDSTYSYRNKNWQPEKGKYYFSEAYHFSYYYETKNNKEGGITGEFGFYVDPESGTLLLEKYITNYANEMTDYVIVQPNGTYILGFTDEFGEKKTIKMKLTDIEALPEKLKYGTHDFKTFFKKLQTTETFGSNKYYHKKLEAHGYERTFQMTQDTVALFLAKSGLPTKALYLVDEVFPELIMPIRQDYGFVLSEGTLVVQEHYETSSGERIGFRLTSIMASEYHLELPD